MPKQATVYFLKCPLSNKLRYIGCTIQELKKRLSHHTTKSAVARLEATKEKFDWINELRKKKLKPLIIPLKTFDNIEDAKNFENKTISVLRNNNIRIYNRYDFKYKHK